MDIEYKLFVGNFHTLNKSGDLENVVLNVEYTYSGFATIDNKKYAFGLTRSVNVLNSAEDINKDGFIDFKDITEDLAKEWIIEAVPTAEVEEMQRIIADNIENQTKLTVQSAPWVEITEGQANPNQPEIKK